MQKRKPPAETGSVGAFIQTKLRPPLVPDTIVRRRRVEALLQDLISRKQLVVLCAAPGSGKTMAVAATFARLRRPVAWLTLDSSETTPGRLVTYLGAAVARVVPKADGAVSSALSSGLSHPEAAGLLAESVAGSGLVLVVDNVERLRRSAAVWQTLELLLLYLPADATAVLLSRHELPTDLFRHPGHDLVALVDDGVLAFTAEEAALALASHGLEGNNAQALVDATGGWITGVLFGTNGSVTPATGLGGETEPLYEYLSSQILEQLEESDRRFLIATSLLDEVDADHAAALGFDDSAERLYSLRTVHLPIVWHSTHLRMRVHPCFQEYLRERLERMDRKALRELHLAHARLLVDDGRDEEAVEAFIRAGVPEAALDLAMRAIRSVVDRLDVDIAERWVSALAPVAPPGASPLVTAQLMIAMARTNVGEALRIADRLAELGERDRWARAEPRDAWLMSWGYVHAGRFDDVDSILEQVPRGPELDGVRYALRAIRDPPERTTSDAGPGLFRGTVDAAIYAGSYGHGRLAPLTEDAPSVWLGLVERPWRLGALRALGRTREALGLLEESLTLPSVPTPLLAQTGPEVLIDAGRRDAAVAMLERGRQAAIATGSVIFQSVNRIVEAKLAVRLDRDPEAARRALSRPECRRGARALRFVGELWDLWMGTALLLEDRDDEALDHLIRCVEEMRSGDRILELPTALVCLAEAAARTGNDRLADSSGDDALATALAQGSDHLVLQALADFPNVCARRRESASGLSERWEAVVRALTVQRFSGPPVADAVVKIVEFGGHGVLVDGLPVRARLSKTYELLSYMMAVQTRCVHRNELHAALFDERRDKSSRAYLRGAIQGLRAILPAGFVDIREDGFLAITQGARIEAESIEFESRVAEAARRHGRLRISETIDALALYDQGPYLAGVHTLWADDRAVRLFGLATEARHQAALLAFGAGRLDDARELTDRVLADDPARESAWRLRLRIAAAMGDERGLVVTYGACREALTVLGLSPTNLTGDLFERLRR